MAYEHTNGKGVKYYLRKSEVTLRGGKQQTIYFFTKEERLDDASLRELSNQWMLYFLKYHLKRNLIKDPMCENHPLNPKK